MDTTHVMVSLTFAVLSNGFVEEGGAPTEQARQKAAYLHRDGTIVDLHLTRQEVGADGGFVSG